MSAAVPLSDPPCVGTDRRPARLQGRAPGRRQLPAVRQRRPVQQRTLGAVEQPLEPSRRLVPLAAPRRIGRGARGHMDQELPGERQRAMTDFIDMRRSHGGGGLWA